jgi:hypothetical protein
MIAPTPQRILREGEVGMLSGFSRSLTWKYGRVTADYRLTIFKRKPTQNDPTFPVTTCNLDQTSVTWGYFEGSKEPVLRFTLQEPPLSTTGGSNCCACLFLPPKKEVTLILHNQQELATWIRSIQILFANSEHQPVQQGDGGSVGDECTICLSDFNHNEILSVLPCGHRYHDECVREWLQCSSKCPLCKKDSLDSSGQPLCTSAKFIKRK